MALYQVRLSSEVHSSTSAVGRVSPRIVYSTAMSPGPRPLR